MIIVDGVRYVTAHDAAKAAGITRDYIGKLCRDGKLPGKFISGRWFVPEEQLGAFLIGHAYKKSDRGQRLSTERREEYHGRTETSGEKRVFTGRTSLEQKKSLAGSVVVSECRPPHMRFRAAAVAGTAGTRTLASQLSHAPGAFTDMGMQLAAQGHGHTIFPLAELVHRAVALMFAVVIVFGGFSLSLLGVGYSASIITSPVPLISSYAHAAAVTLAVLQPARSSLRIEVVGVKK